MRLTDPADGTPLDDGIALVFPGPASFTGEDVVELHLHGSPAVLDRVFSCIGGLGLKAAGRGAFSRRAVENGKIDLTEAEGLADLIEADSESQRLQALNQMGGAWAGRISAWQARLMDGLAWLEASIDFSDEDDVPANVADQTAGALAALVSDIACVLDDRRAGEMTRDGLRVAIIGPPNVGKSTLLNALSGREAAIVSDRPGTTRDIVEVRLNMDGYVVILSDTAGLRETDDPIEAEGVRRARGRADEADLRIVVVDARHPLEDRTRVGLETDIRGSDIVFANKSDLIGDRPIETPVTMMKGSLRTQAGIDAVLGRLSASVNDLMQKRSSALVTRARHREALQDALEALLRAQSASDQDLKAEDIKVAMNALARLLGRVDVEAILDRIFSTFCIGK